MSINSHSVLKNLEVQKNLEEASLKSLRQQQGNVSKEIFETEKRLSQIKDSIRRLKQRVIISEHAILRYIERVMGLDIEEIKRKILPAETEESVYKLGNGRYLVGTHTVRVENFVVITVTTDQ